MALQSVGKGGVVKQVNVMYRDDEKVQARKHQTERAIGLAMENRWEDAVTANRAIIELFPNDADAHNRLGKALMELNRYPDAKKAYKKALELDATNQIARKNLERITVLHKAGATQAETRQVDPTLFIEEMGKSAVTVLQGTPEDILAKLNAGDKLELRQRSNSLVVETGSGKLVGTLEPKLRSRLIKLMDGGNEYAAGLVSVGGGECRIIIKETYKDPSQAGRPSFPSVVGTESLRPYTKESLLHYGNQVEEIERTQDVEEDELGSENGADKAWQDDNVIQQGHVRLNDAAAAEDDDDDDYDE
ncbi:MAG: tetratricopeptide repeat protein [Dehalococcoidia bacterium]